MATSWWDEPIIIAGEDITPREWLKVAWTDLTDVDIAEILRSAAGRDVNANSVALQRKRLGLYKTRSGTPRIFAESEYRRYDDPPVLHTDDLLVLADVEAPYHDADWCSDVVALAVRWGISIVLLAGDFFHFAALSPFAKELLADDDSDVEVSDEIDAVARFGDVLLDNFAEIHCILGNHEKRLTRRAAVAARVRVIRQLLGYRFEKRFNIYPYFYAKVIASTGAWRVAHPKSTSVIPVRVAARLADKYECNYVAAHGHDWGAVTSVAGRYAAACGCCVDPERLMYVATRDTTRPKMQNGAWILRRGMPVLLHPEYAPPEMWR